MAEEERKSGTSSGNYVFDWKSPDMGTTPRRTAGTIRTGNGASESGNGRSGADRTKASGASSSVNSGRTQFRKKDEDILLFGNDEESSDKKSEEKNNGNSVSGRKRWTKEPEKKNSPLDSIKNVFMTVLGVIASFFGMIGAFLASIPGRIMSLLSSGKKKTEKTEFRQQSRGASRTPTEHRDSTDSAKNDKTLTGMDSDTSKSAANRGGRVRTASASTAVGKKRRKKNKKRLIRAWIVRILAACAAILVLVLVVLGIRAIVHKVIGGGSNTGAYPDYVDEELLTVNPYSRPGIETGTIKSIVIHASTDSGTSAKDLRKYYEGLATSQETRVSTNYIVGTAGEVIVCVPDGELAYASNDRNMDSVSIEYCHDEDSGEITDEEYTSLVNITAWLCHKYGLKANDVIRHYDVTGRNCPKYYVDNEDAWTQFRKDLSKAIKKQ